MVGFLPPEIWLIAGASRPERTALARRLAQSLDRAAHIDGETLSEQIVSGAPSSDDAEERERAYELAVRNQCLLARSYAEAGYTPVIDFPVANRFQLDAYRNYLMGGALRVVSIGASLDGGLSVARDIDVPSLMARRAEALVR